MNLATFALEPEHVLECVDGLGLVITGLTKDMHDSVPGSGRRDYYAKRLARATAARDALTAQALISSEDQP